MLNLKCARVAKLRQYFGALLCGLTCLWFLKFAESNSLYPSVDTATHLRGSVELQSESARGSILPRATVTGASKNHESTLLSFLENYHEKNKENIPLVVYDLGLSSTTLLLIQEQHPWIEVRRFNFSRYPEFFDIGVARGEYAWKPIIVKEMLDTTSTMVLWLDSGDKLTHSDSLSAVFLIMSQNGYFTTETDGTIATWVHPDMLAFFDFHDEHKPMCNGAIIGFDKNYPNIYKEVVEPWAHCALNKACIAPASSSRANHRQDQSALTVLLSMTDRHCAFKADITLHTDADEPPDENVVVSHASPTYIGKHEEIKNCHVEGKQCLESTSPEIEVERGSLLNVLTGCSGDFESCQTNPLLNWTDLSIRDFFFLGNSVTRHYAFALKDLLQGQQNIVDRQTEKTQCQGVHGTSSCGFDFLTKVNHTTKIQFFWKNHIGLTKSHDDTSRDVCGQQSNTESCLLQLFRDATPKDVLILGSVPTNTEYFEKMQGDSLKPFHESAPQWLESQMHLEIDDILEMVLRSFPGVIVWHSYPFLNMEKNEHTPESIAFGDLNKCFVYGNSLIDCAARKYGRIVFVDVKPLQAKHLSEYQDLIHHSGALSYRIVSRMLGAVTDKRIIRGDLNHGVNASATLIFALKQQTPNLSLSLGHFWGLGDMIGGMMKTCLLAARYNYDFLIDVRHHPVSDLLQIQHHDHEADVDACVTELPFTWPTQLESFVRNSPRKNTLCLFTNGQVSDEVPSEQCLAVIRRTLSLSRVETADENSYAEVAHIRLGDGEMLKGNDDRTTELENVLEKLEKVNKSALILSDSESVQLKAKAMGFNVQDHQPSHFGLAEDGDSIMGIMKDFIALTKAKRIYYYSVYDWKSGFLSWASALGEGETIPLMSL